jgi:hypothetical protein
MTSTLDRDLQEVIAELIREYAALNDIEALNLVMRILKETIKSTGCKNPDIAPLIQLLSKILRLEVSKKGKTPSTTYN